MKGKPAEIRMDGVHRPSPTSLPVMFFGTLEIAWISPSETSRWQDGIKAKFHTKPKGRKAFDNALQQVLLAVCRERSAAMYLLKSLHIMQVMPPGSITVQPGVWYSIRMSQSLMSSGTCRR